MSHCCASYHGNIQTTLLKQMALEQASSKYNGARSSIRVKKLTGGSTADT